MATSQQECVTSDGGHVSPRDEELERGSVPQAGADNGDIAAGESPRDEELERGSVPQAGADNGDIAAGELSVLERWRVWEEKDGKHVTYTLVTCIYFWFRANGAATFCGGDPTECTPFVLGWNDAWGLLFVSCFLLLRRRSYLVYAINPIRNLVLFGLQSAFPAALAEHTVESEFLRNVISSALQLACGLCICLLPARPIQSPPVALCRGQRHCSACQAVLSRRVLSYLPLFSEALLVLSSIVMLVMGLRQHTADFSSPGEHHGWKILLAVLLGTSEEVSWRQAYMKDNSNFLQAFTWGMNHLVVGEGMDNPWLYGLVTFAYAYALGLCRYRVIVYANHSAIEYIIMDSLVS